jgi:hypothetical protein
MRFYELFKSQTCRKILVSTISIPYASDTFVKDKLASQTVPIALNSCCHDHSVLWHRLHKSIQYHQINKFIRYRANCPNQG